jgi:hypothetical protein
METERLTPYSLDIEQTDKDKLKSVSRNVLLRGSLTLICF